MSLFSATLVGQRVLNEDQYLPPWSPRVYMAAMECSPSVRFSERVQSSTCCKDVLFLFGGSCRAPPILHFRVVLQMGVSFFEGTQT